MSLMEIFLIGIGLSMDAFAVAICKGLSMQKVALRYTVWIALYFGVFQAALPLTGWLLGSQFARHVTRFAPWIAFILLALIGGNMIRESLSKDEEEAEREARERRFAAARFAHESHDLARADLQVAVLQDVPGTAAAEKALPRDVAVAGDADIGDDGIRGVLIGQ